MKEVVHLPSTNVHYDLAEGVLIIGAAALDAAIEAGRNPDDLFELGSLLTQPNRPADPNFTSPMDYEEWDEALDVPTAKWLHALIQETNPEQKSALSEEALIRTGYLGLIPRITYFKNRPGGVQSLYAEAELSGVKMRGYFDSWSPQDFVDYVQRLGKKLGRKPLHEDFVEAALFAGNPSEHHMEKQFGKPSVVVELAGWVNVKEWTTHDFIDWGVHFMFVNEGLLPTSRHLRYVSAYNRGIGPGTDAIYDHEDFSSILDFQTKVAEEYTKQHLFQESTIKLLTEQSDIDIQSVPAVRELLDGLTDNEERLRTYAKYILVSPVLPDIKPSELKKLCRLKRTSNLIEKVTQLNPRVTAAELEVMAAAKGLTNIIWPTDYTNDPLYVANWPEDWSS